jgi:hypothetical protein
MSNINLLEPELFDNKYKIFDIKNHPAREQLALIDFKGRLRLLEKTEDNFEVVKNYKISEDSIYALNYSDNGESKLLLT